GVDHFAGAIGEVHSVFIEALFDPRTDLAGVAIVIGTARAFGGVAVLVDDVGAGIGAAELGHHPGRLVAAAVFAGRPDFGIDLAGEVVGDFATIAATEFVDRHGISI